MRGRVAARRAVAAADVAARQADAQVQPLAAATKAVLAAVHLGRELAHLDLVEMGAGIRAHRTPAGCAERCLCTNWTAIEPSPTAAAQRFVEPERTSPAAKTPGMLVSSKLAAPAASAVRRKPSSCRALARARGDPTPEPLRARPRAEEEEEERERQTSAVGERDRLETPVAAVELGDLAAVADGDAGALEILDQVVG